MDKNEYKVRLEEIKQLIEQENYTEAAAIADRIEWRKVRNVNTLCMISEVYEAVDRYEDSKMLLLRAYRRSPMSRTVLYRLVEVTIALRQFDESIGYYTEYVQAAPNDTNRYILKYKIYRGRGSSVNEQIDILKEYLDQEYNEKYAYELAKLYREADRMQECIAACDDLVLWFHSGKYVIKALELKRKYAALTPKQQEIYDGRFAVEDEERELERIGEEKQMVGTDETTLADTIIEDTEKEIAQAVAQAARGEQPQQNQASVTEKAETATATVPGERRLSAEAMPGEAEQGQNVSEAPVRISEENAARAATAAFVESAEVAAAAVAEEPVEAATAAEDEAPVEVAEAAVEEAAEKASAAMNEEPVETAAAMAEDSAETAEAVAGEFAKAAEAAAEESAETVAAVAGESAETVAAVAGEAAETAEVLTEESAQTAAFDEEIGAVEDEIRDALSAGETVADTAEEAADSAGEEAAKETVEPPRIKTKEELQTGIARDMREIIGNVGRLEYIDEAQQAMDDLIEESKKDQALEREKSRLRMPRLRMPDLQKKQAAGKLTIDDILLSMGERGDAVREAAAKASPYNTDSPGVLSAVDEALLNMGILPEGASEKQKAEPDQDVQAEEETGYRDHVASAMTEIVVDQEETEAEQVAAAMEEEGPEQPPMQQEDHFEQIPEEHSEQPPESFEAETEEFQEDVRPASIRHGSITDEDLREALMETPEESRESFRDKTMEEIIAARTRRIPTERIASLYGRRALKNDFAGGVSSEAGMGTEDADISIPGFIRENMAARDASLQKPDRNEAGGEGTESAQAETASGNVPENTTGQGEAAQQGQGTLTQGSELPSSQDAASGEAERASQEGAVPGAQASLQDEAAREADAASVTPKDGTVQASQSGAQQTSNQQEAAGHTSAAPRGPMLKEELRELFEGFLNVRGLEPQIVSAIRQTLTKGNDRTSRTGNILIFGGHGAGKTTLAMALAKAIAQEKGQEYVKMARIYSTDLNRKDIAATVAKIAGGVLIVEEAGDLDDGIADQLTTAMEFRTDGLVVIFEDEQAYIHDLLMRHPRLTMKFTSEIYIPAYTAQELAGFGEVYADSRDFALSDSSREVLTAKVRSMMEAQDPGQQLSITAVNEVMDKAMAKASSFGRKLFGGKKRYDEVGRVILKDKDFS